MRCTKFSNNINLILKNMILILLNSRDCRNVFNMLDGLGISVARSVGGIDVSRDDIESVITLLELSCILYSIEE